MWFGTATGLIRFDGTTIYRYEHARGIKNTIPDNRINAIIEDADKNLWIGTAQGLVIYNRETDDFTDVDSIPGNTNYLNNRYITSLCDDGQGRMWIGTLGQGLNVYDRGRSTFTYLGTNPDNGKFPPSNYITSLHLDGNKIWAGTKGGVNLFSTRDMRRLPVPVVEQSLASKEITQVSKDHEGNLWLTTADMEIIQLTPEGERYLVQKTLLRRHVRNEGEGSIFTLAIDGKGDVWVAGETRSSGMKVRKTTFENCRRTRLETYMSMIQESCGSALITEVHSSSITRLKNSTRISEVNFWVRVLPDTA
jgi:ligand-binding sensor domain-containing protein